MSDGQDRTEKATPQRMKEVIRKGQLGRSQDLAAWLGLGAAALMLPSVITRGQDAATDQLVTLGDVATDPTSQGATDALRDGLTSLLSTLAPLFAVLVVVTLGVGIAQGGWRPRRFRIVVDHLKPQSAVKRLVGGQAWWQGAKTLLKTAVVALVLYVAVKGMVPLVLASGHLPVDELLAKAGGGTANLLRLGIVAGLLLAVADVVVVMKRNRKSTRMSTREIKEEHKRTEGDPQVKGQIRSRQMMMSRNRMLAEVATADVVLVNPTHVAVALRYEPGTGAPRVVAKGAGAVAAKLRTLAAEHRVPMVEDVPLARALHASCELGQEIPGHLFTAVATVLAFVMQLRRRGAAAGKHRLAGGSTLGADDTTDHKAAARAARRPARAAAAPSTASGRTS
ncbi:MULTISPECIES: EscU/YscU/HrcU family type III secretion system export apparatus switch protein [Cellulomonas]|uniref:Type III secretion exporter n=1 Tax=Cellulomonas gilvus (strain ATCC 13127 / NRRL B-14078) TaxID=593907 RepID=F8A5Y5_CELGA|nr:MULTISPECIES: EscU/YscU/HrcU family type III secretion system export apparatus switch protein [Cellulomonas]AEI11000.1 type III secretion exporter [Cellulomonas gilvus ATCC 13127]MCR6688153.1 EscU/YscU/HrcU family type III secretion system export apparatus switch protein [Cellulomonas sp.]